MNIGSRNHKVYTTDSKAALDAEDVGVEGKRYPVNGLGKAVARHPCLMLLTIFLPIAFFIVGCVYVDSRMEYSLADFQLSKSVAVRQSQDAYNDVVDGWTAFLSGETQLLPLLDLTMPRNKLRDAIEMRSKIDVSDLQRYCLEYGIANMTRCAEIGNVLTDDMMRFIIAVEAQIRNSDVFKEVCFTNDLEYGTVNQVGSPDCVPPTSITGYAFASYNDTTRKLWHMDGKGTLQKNYVPRLLVNPNYGWFLGSNFSAINPSSNQIRSAFVMASSPGQSEAEYQQKVKNFVAWAASYIQESTGHPFLRTYLSGDVVENIRIEEEASKEGYKVAIAFAICFVLSWWHCGSFVMGLYAGAQVIITHLAAAGLYTVIYKSLPLMTYSAVVWVMTFGLHGTLSFYDMFVYTGVMATKGRQNNLSVPQRVSFTIRRVTLGVWLANILAIVIFAVNTSSAFDSVRHFSVFMIIAFLWNMYFIVLPTPAWVCMHHTYFSNKRRNLQKQVDVLNAKAAACRRNDASAAVLAAVQANASLGEVVYSLDEDVAAARIGANRGINKRHYKGVGNFLAQEMREGRDCFRNARDELVGAAHKVRKTKRQVLGQPVGGKPGVAAAAFEMEDFMDVGDGGWSGGGGGAPRAPRSRLYVSRRLVRHADVIHVPDAMTVRSEASWGTMCGAIGQTDDEGLAPPHVHSLHTVSDRERAVRAFAGKWGRIAQDLRIEGTELGSVGEMLPLVARAVVRAQDPSYVVGGRRESVADGEEAPAAVAVGAGPAQAPVASGMLMQPPVMAPAGGGGGGVRVIVDPGSAGFGVQKMRARWRYRNTVQRRSGCCGLCGSVQSETAEQRMQRLMRRQVKREGYSLFERFIIRRYVPFVYWARWVLFALFIVLGVLVCVFGGFITRAGLPTTLVANDGGQSAGWAAMENTFGQRGTCVFCGPYYRPIDEYRAANTTDVASCGVQMNTYLDACGVCGGDNACMDCAGDPDGPHVEQCDSCELPGNPSCNCVNGRDCSYCAWELNISGKGGADCSVECTSTTCLNGGHCDQYTGKCVCPSKFAGERCEECAPWLLPIESNPRCSWECNSLTTSDACRCNSLLGECTSCPAGTRGYNCDQPAMDCGAHGRYSASLDVCLCDSGWGGARCDVAAQCNYRGPWLEASESPTGEAMCGCKGHWRGPTCQLCDCVNGGMCNDEGVCMCTGAFMGSRCQTCAGDCVSHGTCPSNFASSLLNIRACIEERCSEEDKAAERACGACPVPTRTTAVCSPLTSRTTCSQKAECWWSESVSACVSATQENVTASAETFECRCANNDVWTGQYCHICRAPPGGRCEDANTIVDCAGLSRTSYREAIATDQCGVCGGDGLCRGCDGVPGSGLVYDLCGVCGGNGACIGYQEDRRTTPIRVNYMLDMRNAKRSGEAGGFTSGVMDAIQSFTASVRSLGGDLTTARSAYEDFVLASDGAYTSDAAFYNWTKSVGRLSETVFDLRSDLTWRLTHVVYSVLTSRTALNEALVGSPLPGSAPRAMQDSQAWIFLNNNVAAQYFPPLRRVGIEPLFTAPEFSPAMGVYLSGLSLWFAVGIGLAVCFVFLCVFFVSLLSALGGTAVAVVVCFGTMTVCTMFKEEWELDAVLQVCISCTIPIGVEYVVHIITGYFDYLQTTTSHLFAKDVSRRTAVVGALLRSLPAVCTSVVTVVLSSIAFDVSELIPSKRSGQVCITMHLVLLVTVFFFTGAVSALGPLRSYQHWTLSALICLGCGVLAAVAVAIMYGAGGVMTPNGVLVLSKRK